MYRYIFATLYKEVDLSESLSLYGELIEFVTHGLYIDRLYISNELSKFKSWHSWFAPVYNQSTLKDRLKESVLQIIIKKSGVPDPKELDRDLIKEYCETINYRAEPWSKASMPIRQSDSFLINMVSVMAEKGLVSEIKECLEFMWKHFPNVDMKQVIQDEHIRSSIGRIRSLRPVLTHEESYNIWRGYYVGVTNKSLYSVTNVSVKVSYLKKDTLETVQEIHTAKGKMGVGGHKKWRNVFDHAGWSGRNVESVQVNVSCDEHRYFNSNSS